jgi:hypothetical protein
MRFRRDLMTDNVSGGVRQWSARVRVAMCSRNGSDMERIEGAPSILLSSNSYGGYVRTLALTIRPESTVATGSSAHTEREVEEMLATGTDGPKPTDQAPKYARGASNRRCWTYVVSPSWSCSVQLCSPTTSPDLPGLSSAIHTDAFDSFARNCTSC